MKYLAITLLIVSFLGACYLETENRKTEQQTNASTQENITQSYLASLLALYDCPRTLENTEHSGYGYRIEADGTCVVEE